MNMNTVGIDVYKRKNMVSLLRPSREVVAKPFGVSLLYHDIQSLIKQLLSLDGKYHIVMAYTGRYYAPRAHDLIVAGLFVSSVTPQLIRNYQDEDTSLRKVKSDKAGPLKIVCYTLDRWVRLNQQPEVSRFRHYLLAVDCVHKVFLNAFVEHYKS